MNQPTIVLTGATGFIGGRVVKLAIARGLKVLALVRPTSDTSSLDHLGVAVQRVDLDDPAAVLNMPAGSAIIHVGGPGLSDLLANREGAKEGVSNFLMLCQKANATKFVYLSSIKARPPVIRDGKQIQYTPDVYSLKKAEEEQLVIKLTGGLYQAVIRAPAVFGFPDTKSGTIFRATAGRFVPVLPTKHAACFSMIHVDALAAALLNAATYPADQTIMEVADQPTVSWNDIVYCTKRHNAILVRVPPILLRLCLGLAMRLMPSRAASLSLVEDRIDDLTKFEWICEDQAIGAIQTTDIFDKLRNTADLYREVKS